MAKPTVASVYALSRALLDDNVVSGGEVYKDSVLEEFFGVAYRQMADVFAEFRVGVFKRVSYFKVDAYQWRIELSDEGISVASEPQRLREAGISAEYAISNVSNTLPLVFTTSATPSAISTADAVYVFGVNGQTAANGKWYVSGVSGSNITVGGGDTSSAYTSGGTLVKISGKFTDMYPGPSLTEEAVAVSNMSYRFRENAIECNPVAAARLFELTFYESPNPPSSGEVSVHNSLNFLGTQTAALAAATIGGKEISERLERRAQGHMRELLSHYNIRDYMPSGGDR